MLKLRKSALQSSLAWDKWHQYLYGKRDITVHTDHQPLETIFKKPLSKAPRRLQRIMLKLQRYQFTVRYKKGKELYIADTLSRAPVTDQPISTDKQECEVFRLEMAEMEVEPDQVTPDTLQRIRRETAKDPVLAALHTMIMNGWPSERKKSQSN